MRLSTTLTTLFAAVTAISGTGAVTSPPEERAGGQRHLTKVRDERFSSILANYWAPVSPSRPRRKHYPHLPWAPAHDNAASNAAAFILPTPDPTTISDQNGISRTTPTAAAADNNNNNININTLLQFTLDGQVYTRRAVAAPSIVVAAGVEKRCVPYKCSKISTYFHCGCPGSDMETCPMECYLDPDQLPAGYSRLTTAPKTKCVGCGED